MSPQSFARRFPLLRLVAASVVLAACDGGLESPLAPPAFEVEAAPSPSPAVYGLGAIRRATPRSCSNPETRAFDFRLGKWEVRNADTGGVNGHDDITSELSGCVQMEAFIAPNGFRSRSLSVFDEETGIWYQDFLSINTTNIRFTGGPAGDDFVFTADQLAFDLGTSTVRDRTNRVTWTPHGDGTMTQVNDAAFDGTPLPTVVNRWTPVADFDPPSPLVLPFCQVIPGFRDLDFWAGHWTVTSPRGPDLGSSLVSVDLSGCLIEERFLGANGYESRSFLFYDFVTATWFRTLVDTNGKHVRLSGVVEPSPGGARLVLTGADRAPDGSPVQLRVTLEPSGDGRVVQTWEESRDGGDSFARPLVLQYDIVAS